ADQQNVVRVCRDQLLTAFGLRSLAPGSPAYHPHYGGGIMERDGGYHQGPVWAWLLGPFCLAMYRVHRPSIEGACDRPCLHGRAARLVRRISVEDLATQGRRSTCSPRCATRSRTRRWARSAAAGRAGHGTLMSRTSARTRA